VCPTSAFDPVDFYHQAGSWYEVKANEAVIRSVVSRGYYAAFLSARDVAGTRSAGENVHNATVNYFLGKTDAKALGIGNRLRNLRRIRNRADYDLSPACVARDAGEALKLSQQILVALGRL
jgi:hypothetical protein